MRVDLPSVETPATNPANPAQPDVVTQTFGKDYDPHIGGIEENRPRIKEREIDIKEIQDANVAEKVKINLFSETSSSSDWVTAPTNTSNIPPDGQRATNPAQAMGEAPKPFINAPNDSGSAFGMDTKIKKEDLSAGAEIMVAGGDIIISVLLKLLAGDSTSTNYGASANQLGLLRKAVVNFMYQKQIDASPVFLLVFAIAGAYGPQAKNAVESRMAIRRAKERNSAPAPTTQQGKTSATPPTYTPPQQQAQRAQPVQQKERPKPVFEDLTSLPNMNTHKDDALPANERGEVHFPNPQYSWENPDPNITVYSREELLKFVNQGIFPKYIQNKTNKMIKEVPYKDGKQYKNINRIICISCRWRYCVLQDERF